MRKEKSKLSKILITILMALSCVSNITVFAEEAEDGNSGENEIMLATSSGGIYTIAVGQTITLNGEQSAVKGEWYVNFQ